MNQEIRSKLDRICNILWGGGLAVPTLFVEQISYLIYLKLLDEREADLEVKARLLKGKSNGKLLFPDQASRYRWSNWRFKSGKELRDFLGGEVFPYMASLLKEEPQVAIYFQDAKLEIEDPHVLKEVVDGLDTFQFGKLGPDVKGDIFEYLLQYLSRQPQSDMGQFRTPRQIRMAMVEMLDPDLGDTMCDLACGTAGFLVDSVEHILAKYSAAPREVPIYGEEWLVDRGWTLAQARREIPNLQTYRKGAGEKIPDWELLEYSIFGFEVSRQMMRISMMNLVLHGIRNAHVKRANSLSELGGMSDEDLRRRYKCILMNPPFAGMLPAESIRKDLPTQSKKSELLFLGLAMESLAPGGTCAMIVPEGALFGSTSGHVELRKQLMEDYELLAVISLPAGVFKPYAGVKTGILVFRKPQPVSESADRGRREREARDARRNGKVWFYQINNDGYDPDKITGGGRPETPEWNDLPEMLRHWKSYKNSGFKKPPGTEAGALLPPGTKEASCWWAKISTISKNDFNLAAGRYKPRVAEKTP
ncbi:MAG TPA: class I SAM-dependent DNA methyltransferase, partial [Candidatus Dormibacteraeota bacterium]|nr:class I SAM-dependent DNA methyltransferase [Candidatus Dormibacteraeota bacterium]